MFPPPQTALSHIVRHLQGAGFFVSPGLHTPVCPTFCISPWSARSRAPRGFLFGTPDWLPPFLRSTRRVVWGRSVEYQQYILRLSNGMGSGAPSPRSSRMHAASPARLLIVLVLACATHPVGSTLMYIDPNITGMFQRHALAVLVVLLPPVPRSASLIHGVYTNTGAYVSCFALLCFGCHVADPVALSICICAKCGSSSVRSLVFARSGTTAPLPSPCHPGGDTCPPSPAPPRN